MLVATGVRTGYTSGSVSIDEEGKLVGAGDLGAQTTQAMKNLGLALEAAAATFADIVKTTTFVVNKPSSPTPRSPSAPESRRPAP